jgi:ribonuclease BN (tRNA processing enzyme)
MTDHVLAAWSDEVQGRRVNVHEIAPGIVYRDAQLTVTALESRQAESRAPTFGYRFQSADRRIVISCDPNPGEAVVAQCKGCDVLLHDVDTPNVRLLGELATRARPELLILHHQGDASDTASEAELIRAMRAVYRGRFVVGHDLDVF